MGRKELRLMKRLGENVRFYRLKKSLTQEELAFELSIDRSYMGKIERGMTNPSLGLVSLIATVLDVEVLDLLK